MKKMNISKSEQLMLRSFDVPFSREENEKLDRLMSTEETWRREQSRYSALRDMIARKADESFGPFFAERVISRIKRRANEIDYLIWFFFKKYQVLALGILVALLVANIFLADQLTVPSLFGIQKESIEDFITIDLYKDFK